MKLGSIAWIAGSVLSVAAAVIAIVVFVTGVPDLKGLWPEYPTQPDTTNSGLNPLVADTVAAAAKVEKAARLWERTAHDHAARAMAVATLAREAADAAKKHDPNYGTRSLKEDGQKGRYEGQLNSDGDAEGVGVVTWEDGTRYEGRWHKNMYSGPGVMLWTDGEKHAVDFVDGDAEGAGVIWYSGGAIIAGQMHQGYPAGLLVYTYPPSSTELEEVGEFVTFVEKDGSYDTVLQGFGVHRCKNKCLGIGTWNHGALEGYGAWYKFGFLRQQGLYKKGDLEKAL
jgi:hypothetical protein